MTIPGPQAPVPTHDPWVAVSGRFRTRSQLLEARHKARQVVPDESAGGAPLKEPPSYKVERRTAEYEPLDKATVDRTSRNALLQRRREAKAVQEQAEYDRWDERTMIWEVPKCGLPADHVANPEHPTQSAIVLEKRREGRKQANLLPDNEDIIGDRPGPMTTTYVEKPHAGTRNELFDQRKQETMADIGPKIKGAKGYLNPKERLTKREDQWTLARLSQKAGRSRRQMQEDRKMSRMTYEETMHQAQTAKHKKEEHKWADKPKDAFWKHRPNYVAKPQETSAARLFTIQRPGLGHERYNVYSDAPPDPFKAEHFPKHVRPDEDTPTNCAKIAPFPREEFVSNLKQLRGKETNFTDYQLYFKVNPHKNVEGVVSKSEFDPLYSGFTKDNTFDPNIWMPPHKQKIHRGANQGALDDMASTGGSSAGSQELESGMGVSFPESADMNAEVPVVKGPRPATAKLSSSSEGAREVVPTPSSGKPTQRPLTSIPSQRQRTKGGGSKQKMQRPWTSGATRPALQPSSLVKTMVMPIGQIGYKTIGVRSGAWQRLSPTKTEND